MASLAFAVKFSLSEYPISSLPSGSPELMATLFVLFVLSLAARTGTGGITEAIALGIEIVQLVLLSIRLYFYIRHRNSPSRLTHDRFFFLSLWLISLTGAIWISVHAPSMLDDFAGLSQPEAAAIIAITLSWLAWTLTVHLIWLAVQEHIDAEDAEDEPAEPIRWPDHGAFKPSSSPPRISRPKRISAKIVAVAHGSDPLLWARKKNRHGQGYARGLGVQGLGQSSVQPARPTYAPRDRQSAVLPPPPPPPMRTTYNHWSEWELEAV
ncbi:hypothetical protein C8Q79DRAFT_925542 [Trametes meyenii]|nr:hypothetical protein C8Q79DRAFT_925542 [Trametes meyenii]